MSVVLYKERLLELFKVMETRAGTQFLILDEQALKQQVYAPGPPP